MTEDLLAPCPTCGFYRDTPNHELGCSEGRAAEEARVEVQPNYEALAVQYQVERDELLKSELKWREDYMDLQNRYDKLAEYVKEAAGPESALVPISTLHNLIPLEQHERAIMNVMQLDMLSRCHEDRFTLKQRVRELQTQLDEAKGELERVRIGVLLADDAACDGSSESVSLGTAKRHLEAVIDILRPLVPKEEGDRLALLICEQARRGER